MKLTKLELSGFKSFADTVELTFESGVTAIVGPLRSSPVEPAGRHLPLVNGLRATAGGRCMAQHETPAATPAGKPPG